MRTVRMRYYISGGRADGTDWPHMGETLTADDGEAAELVGAGLADWADLDAPVTPPPAAAPEPSTVEPAVESADEPPAVEPPAVEPPPAVPQADPAPAAGGTASPPPVRAPRADWAAHAMSLGVAQADVDEMTKAQLISQYGNNGGA